MRTADLCPPPDTGLQLVTGDKASYAWRRAREPCFSTFPLQGKPRLRPGDAQVASGKA